MMQIEILRKLVNENKIKWSVHCLERMGERDISRMDVKNCISKGERYGSLSDGFPSG